MMLSARLLAEAIGTAFLLAVIGLLVHILLEA